MTTLRLDHRQIVSLDIAADAVTVWEHLREPAKVRRWFGWDYDGLDAEIQQIFVAGARVSEMQRRRLTRRARPQPRVQARRPAHRDVRR